MPAPTFEQILTVLNDGQPLDPASVEFCVLVGGRFEIPGQGPMAGKTVTLREEHWWPFQRGELLIVNGRGCELFGEGRRTVKWDVLTFETHDYAAAVALSALVKGEHEKGWHTWDGARWARVADQTGFHPSGEALSGPAPTVARVAPMGWAPTPAAPPPHRPRGREPNTTTRAEAETT